MDLQKQARVLTLSATFFLFRSLQNIAYNNLREEKNNEEKTFEEENNLILSILHLHV